MNKRVYPILLGQPQGESRSKLCFERGFKNKKEFLAHLSYIKIKNLIKYHNNKADSILHNNGISRDSSSIRLSRFLRVISRYNSATYNIAFLELPLKTEVFSDFHKRAAMSVSPVFGNAIAAFCFN